MIHIIYDMYKKVPFSVKCEGGLTDDFDTTVGVKQGCILSPFFFQCFS